MSNSSSDQASGQQIEVQSELQKELLQSGQVPDDWQDLYSESASEDVDGGASVNGSINKESRVSNQLHAFYAQGLGYLEQTVGEVPMVAVDIETTGLNHREDEIVSIGLVEFTAQRIFLNTAKHWLVSPQDLSDTSVVVHGITHSDVSSAPTIERVLPELLPILAGKLVVVHYRAMEREFFRGACSSHRPWLFPVMDTFTLELSMLTKAQAWWQRLLNKPLLSLRLPNARLRYSLPDYQNHNALIDAIATAELLQAQIQKWNLSDRLVKEMAV